MLGPINYKNEWGKQDEYNWKLQYTIIKNINKMQQIKSWESRSTWIDIMFPALGIYVVEYNECNQFEIAWCTNTMSNGKTI